METRFWWLQTNEFSVSESNSIALNKTEIAVVAQLVEYGPSKSGVASSSLVYRSEHGQCLQAKI